MKDKAGRVLTPQEITGKILTRFATILLELEVMLLNFVVNQIPSHVLRRFFYRLAGIKIGNGSAIHMGARFYDPRNIVIGNDSIIGEETVLDGRDKLIIGSHVDLASEVMIYNSQHNIYSSDFHAEKKEVIIGDYVFIGPRAIILSGVKIKKGAVVGAGAVVTKDVEEMDIVGGVPAKVIGKRNLKNLEYTLGRAAWFR